MHHIQVHISHSLRFRRWSRNRFAAFCSLGKCVNIGKVCKSITEVSLKKQSKTGAVADVFVPSAGVASETREENFLCSEEELLLDLLLAKVMYHTSVDSYCGNCQQRIIYNFPNPGTGI